MDIKEKVMELLNRSKDRDRAIEIVIEQLNVFLSQSQAEKDNTPETRETQNETTVS